MAGPNDDSVEMALEELEREPLLPDRRQEAPEEEIEIADAEDDAPAPSDTQTGDRQARTQPEPGPKREVPVEEGIDQLRARLQASDAARRQAEERARAAEEARARAAGDTQDANVGFLQSALDGVKQGIAMLKANLAEAHAVQDWNAVSDIQVEISRAAQREGQIEAGLEQLKAMPRDQPRAAPQPIDPVEAVARQLTPNAAAWIRQHGDYVTDPAKNARLMSAHYAAMGEGIEADSAAYIQHVERTLGLGGARAEPVAERREAVPESRPKAPPAAPPSRSNGGSSNPTRVTLTREQREMARELFPDELQQDPSGRKSEQAYARNLLILQREKRLN